MSKDSEAPLLSDCQCNICMDIFVEPVTLPCQHTLCKSCFQLTVEKATLCCPFCRRRVSSWARYNARRNTLVNSELWAKIQKHFPEECQRRISGQDIEDTFLPQPLRCLSKPGELRQEYEAEITKAEAERRAHEEEESKASEQYILRLLAEEEQEQKLKEELKKQMEEQLLQDEMLARELSFSLNSSTEERMHNGLPPGPSPDSCKTSKSKSSNSADIKKYLSQKSCKIFAPKLLVRESEEENTSCSGVSNKNSFTLEKERMDEMLTESLQTISATRNTVDSYIEPSLLDSNIGNSTEPSFPGLDLSCPSTCKMNGLVSVTDREDCETVCLFSKSSEAGYDVKKDNFTGNLDRPNHPGNAAPQETLFSVTSDNQQDSSIPTCNQVKMENKNESLKLFTTEIHKRKSQESPSKTVVDLVMNDKRRRTFTQIDDEDDMDNIQQQIYLEQTIYERYKQEEEDRLLALQLQREMDKEQKTLNRKKGSPDEYHLRPKTSQSEREFPVLRKPCKNSQTNREQQKSRRSSHNENRKPSNKLQTKSSPKGGNVLNCVLNSPGSRSSELLPNKQKTIVQMFKRPATS
ncbi:E3 ubiquitin-protein ligase RNF168 [Anolis carolinensis]|uniref:RING-type E3 ubiquitin transferase n=1 Tax=Anolis carolinensis TaxID=28377 RepID=A0A803U145_ANOCA|nr:PREDICTED: E3 ubiquitin-protein ligase RNF168 [Anolis carolinensis]|eukprot:XP_003218403.1 PREDICTED: E3 ubiquitin-protein ligase RNF168 [Anolis carolinensis]